MKFSRNLKKEPVFGTKFEKLNLELFWKNYSSYNRIYMFLEYLIPKRMFGILSIVFQEITILQEFDSLERNNRERCSWIKVARYIWSCYTSRIKHFKGHCLKIGRSRSISMKLLAVLRSDIYLSPDKVYDTYVDVNTNLQLDINIYNSGTLYSEKSHFEIHKKECLE